MAAASNPTASALVALGELFSPQRLGLLLGIAVVVALTVGGWLWSRTPEYRVLYANVSDRDGGAIVAALQQLNVPYKFADGSGAVMVPDNRVHEARLQLASQGLPRGGQVGFELMENPKLGASQFLEQVNYQRALEGELARSIQSLSAVQSARVHLALAKPSVFVREQQKPTASVLLNLNRGRGLDPAQVNAIVHLVSSSVPDMPVKNVTVVDQSGALLSANNGNPPNTAGLDASQLKYLRELEASYVQRIESIIAPLVGPTNVRAQVTADVDFSQTERAEETYKPNQNQTDAAIRSQQTSEETSANATKAGGVPGALSNQPPVSPTAPLSVGQPAPAGQPAQPGAQAAAIQQAANQATAPASVNNARKDATINYEVDKTIKHVRQPLGGLRRLSVAVVVNHRKETSPEGKVATKPLAKEEIQQITDLVKEAVGYSEQRGDTLNVANSAFNEPEVEAAPEVPFWKDPDYVEPAKNIGKNALIAALVLYLVLGVLRPTLKNLAERAALPPPNPVPANPQPGAPSLPKSYEANLEVARQLAKDEPKLVASVVKNWVSNNE